MSASLINRSPDLKRLRDEGFNLAIQSGYVLLKDVPYLNPRREIRRGVLVAKLCLANDVTTRPDDHVAFFAGEYPSHQDGRPIIEIGNPDQRLGQALTAGVQVDYQFSAKPTPPYADYYEKLTKYVTILSGPARAIDPSLKAKTFPVVHDDDEDSVFNYMDTASSRAEIVMVTRKLAGRVIGIVGLGGTGSYVLDLIAKTPVREIHLFDGDTFLQHNAFRTPGAPSGDALAAQSLKVRYLEEIYSRMHRGIVAHENFMDAQNVDELRGMSFVFLCMDPGEGKRLVVERLEELGTSFIDVGMDVELVDDALRGILRVTTSTPGQRDHLRRRVSLADATPDDVYRSNIQVAELNALNAALAVIKWKKLEGVYFDFEHENHTTYTIDGNAITNEIAT